MPQQADLLQEDASASRKRKEKSPDALRTISEAAEVLDVPQHVLRFWETKFPQITPLKRNGGRRFYRPEDIAILQQIKFLLYKQGYTIKGARKAIETYLSAAALPEHDTAKTGWYQSVPSANSNDNAHAETQLQSKEGADTPPAAPSATAKTQVDAMRQELVQMRESLSKLLPNQQ
jgi:DNA-binding transcriptional MerR regulator